jgi:hypothetical protein
MVESRREVDTCRRLGKEADLLYNNQLFQ